MFRKTRYRALGLLGFCLVVALSPAVLGGSPISSPGPVTVSLRGGSRRSVEAQELYGVVEISLPFGSLPTTMSPLRHRVFTEDAETKAPESSAGEVEQASAEPESLEPRNAARRDGGRTGEGGRGGKSPTPGALPRTALLDRRLIQDCVSRALRGMARAGVAARLDSYGSRARWAAALPELRLRGGRSADSSLRLTPTVDDPYRYTQSDGADLFFEVDLRWRLDRLLYDSDELAIERLRSQYSSAQAKRIHDVLDRLADWQTNAARFADPSLSPKAHVEAWVRMSIAGFWLDAYTGGWFGDAVELRIEALTEGASVE